MRSSDLPSELIDRGIHWQVDGFTLVAIASAAILAEFSGSELRAYIYFEIAVTRLYWALVIPLAGLFDGARKMFEKMSDIRAKRRQRWIDEGRREGRQEGHREGRQEGHREGRQEGRQEGHREGRLQERETLREELHRLGVNLPQEAIDYLEGKRDDGE